MRTDTKQQKFIFGGWYAPANEEKYFRWFRECGLEVFTYLGGEETGLVNSVCYDDAVELCEQFEIKYLVNVSQGYPKRFPAQYPEKANFLGFLVKDEPLPSSFDKVKAEIAAYEEQYPHALEYVNLYPSYVDPAVLGCTYDEYVSRFADEVLAKVKGRKVLSFDYYPIVIVDGKKYLNETWLRDTERIAVIAKRLGAERACFVQTMPIIGTRDRIPSLEEIRLQVYVYAAYGYGWINYFCYATPPVNFEFSDTCYAMIDREGNRTHLYDAVKKVNAELQEFASEYFAREWKGVLHVPATDRELCEGFSLLKEALTIEQSGLVSIHSDADAIVGCFAGEAEPAYVFVNYNDISEGITAHLRILFSDAKEVALCCEGKWEKRSLSDGALNLTLAPGGGCFLFPVKGSAD